MNVCAISGSLRAHSTNTALLQATIVLAPAPMKIGLCEGLALIPHFNPDLEEKPIDSVQALRLALGRSQGLIISTPEYAHGIPGVLKNALDWLVGSGETVDLPLALISASTRSRHAVESLTRSCKLWVHTWFAKRASPSPSWGHHPVTERDRSRSGSANKASNSG